MVCLFNIYYDARNNPKKVCLKSPLAHEETKKTNLIQGQIGPTDIIV